MAAAAAWFYRTGATLYYGDAEAHLNIARRIVDSRTPGWYQLGTTWLPLPHLLMIPLVRHDELWRTGLGGAITAAAAMTLAGAFLFAAVRRIFRSDLGGAAALAVFLLNPNTLYLGSIPMSEPFFCAALFGLLYFTVRFGETNGWGALSGAGISACAATLTRYEGWFVLPFAALFVLIAAGKRRRLQTLFFCVIAGLGPMLWLAHQRYYYGDPLYFYRGPYSAMAIQGMKSYPGLHNWRQAAQYFLTAGRLVVGWPGVVVGAAGLAMSLALNLKRRAIWPAVLLSLAPVFLIWSMYSASTPIFVPVLWPFSWYNTRYGLALLPLAALGAGSLARFGKVTAAVVVGLSLGAFLIHPGEHSVTWQESNVNSLARREWIRQTADWLRSHAGPADTYFTSFNDLTGIYRTLGVPLRYTLTGDNEVEWYGASRRPDLFLWTPWAVVQGGDEVQGIIDRARLHGPRYELAQRISVKGAPVIEIYRRIYDNSVP